jgi:hypothetical protein
VALFRIVTKETVSRDMKPTIVFAVTCASSWVGEKSVGQDRSEEGDPRQKSSVLAVSDRSYECQC